MDVARFPQELQFTTEEAFIIRTVRLAHYYSKFPSQIMREPSRDMRMTLGVIRGTEKADEIAARRARNRR